MNYFRRNRYSTYTASNILGILSQLVLQYFLVNTLSIGEYAIYATALLFTNYTNYFTLGFSTVLSVKVPQLSKFKNTDELNSIVGNSLLYYLILLILSTTITVIILNVSNKYQEVTEQKILIFLFLISSIKAVLVQKFFKVILRTNNEIHSLSKVQIISSIVVISLAPSIGFYKMNAVIAIMLIEVVLNSILLAKVYKNQISLKIKNLSRTFVTAFTFWKVNSFTLLYPILVSSLALKNFDKENFAAFSIFFVIQNIANKYVASADKLNYILISEEAPEFNNSKFSKLIRAVIAKFFGIHLIGIIVYFIFNERIIENVFSNYIQYKGLINVAVLSTILGYFNIIGAYFDTTNLLKLKYYIAGIRYAIFFIIFLILKETHLLTPFNLAIAVIIADIGKQAGNLFFLQKKIPNAL